VSRARGVALQLALARYLTAWWPSAESAGSGRNGTDITGTPGIVWECKTAREFRPLQWCKQARRHAGDIDEFPAAAVTVYFPDGLGEKSMGSALAMMTLDDMIDLLILAGYGTKGELTT
jgi:hypothetical protein